MPRQHEPPAGETTPSVAVRRAVAVPVPGKDPGTDLRPRTPGPTSASAPGPGSDSAADPDTPASASTPASSESAPGRRSRSADPAPAAAPAPATSSAPAVAEEGRRQEQQQQQRQATEPGEAESEAATAGAVLAGKGDGANAGADESVPGRLRSPMVAAAAIVGAVLICVPLLVLALSRDDDRTVETTPVGGTALAPGTSDDLPAVDYQADSPSPSASSSASGPKSDARAKSKPLPSASPTADTEKKAAPRPDAEKTADDGAKKPKAEKSPAITARQLANALSARVNAQLKNVATGKCADLPDFDKGSVDGPVSQFNCRPTTQDNQLWDLKVANADGGPQGASLFVIKNRKDGMCMDLPNYGSVAAGTKVTEYHCRPDADNQLWWLDPRSGGYWIRNVASNLCMSVVGGGSAGNDARLQVVRCDSGSSALRWSVVSVVKPS